MSEFSDEENAKFRKEVKFIILSVMVFTITTAALGMWGCPQYNVWQRGLAGQAELKQAEWNRRIKVREAEALKESAQHLADAEVIRARGVASANKIIGDSLKGNESYLRYLWIQGLHDGNSEVIYVPTEANLPILEAGNRKPKTR